MNTKLTGKVWKCGDNVDTDMTEKGGTESSEAGGN